MGWAAIWSLGLDQRTTPAVLACPHFPWPQLTALGPSSQAGPSPRPTRGPYIGTLRLGRAPKGLTFSEFTEALSF